MSKIILIVDDSIVVRMTLNTLLIKMGYHVIEAENGQDALDKVKETSVDLIICDLKMPVMDGLSFVRLIKEEAQYRFVPIIMLTTEMDVAKTVGVSVWMVKPFEQEKLLDAVSKLLG